MSISMPTNCANPECRQPSIKPIHCSSQRVAIDAVDGPQVFAHLITFRCLQCGHTWGTRRYSADASILPSRANGFATLQAETSNRGW